MVARYCIEGGMSLSEAYGRSDFYILKVDKCKSMEEISALHAIMCEDYARHMKNLRRKKVCSIHVAKCIDYIYEHLHTRITVEQLAELTGISPLIYHGFSKRNRPFHQRIRPVLQDRNGPEHADIPEHSPAQIAAILAFPSQSYFNEVFKNVQALHL